MFLWVCVITAEVWVSVEQDSNLWSGFTCLHSQISSAEEKWAAAAKITPESTRGGVSAHKLTENCRVQFLCSGFISGTIRNFRFDPFTDRNRRISSVKASPPSSALHQPEHSGEIGLERKLSYKKNLHKNYDATSFNSGLNAVYHPVKLQEDSDE